MITVKEAVANASQYIRDVFTDAKDLQLEEVEWEESLHGGGLWNVTLSFLRPLPRGAELATLATEIASVYSQIINGLKYERVYKVVAVDGDSGDCKSIKIRQLQ